MRGFPALAGAAAALIALYAGAVAQQPRQPVKVGVLECRGGASVGFVVGSVTHLGCVFHADGLPEDRYVATIRKVGVDLGITQESVKVWDMMESPCPKQGNRHIAASTCRHVAKT